MNLVPRDLGATYECQQCDALTVRSDACPRCGSTDLERINGGP